MDQRLQIGGWILFILSALGFIASSLRNGDVLGLVGSVFFLIGCLAFLVPLVWPRAPD